MWSFSKSFQDFYWNICNIFRFVYSLSSINDRGELKINYYNIYLKKKNLGKENNTHETRFLGFTQQN